MKACLITTVPNKFELNDVKKYVSLDDLIEDDILESEDLIIINDFKEIDYNASMSLMKIVDKYAISHLMYLNDNPHLSISYMVESLGGTVDTEDYLSDLDTLQVLITELYDRIPEDTKPFDSSIPVTQNELEKFLISDEDTNTIKSFFRDVSLGKADFGNKLYMDTIQTALDKLDSKSSDIKDFIDDNRQSNQKMIEFSSSYNRISSEEYDKLSKQYDELKSKYDINESTKNSGAESSIQSFGSYKVSNKFGTEFIVFKEYSGVRYLTSFVLGYKQHLEGEMNKRVRLIFIIPNNFNFIEKYKDERNGFEYYDIQNEAYKNEDSLNNTIGWTEKPINNMYKFFSGLSSDYLIIVDRTHGDKPCVVGNTVQWDCFSGKTESDLYKKEHQNRIFSMKSVYPEDISIPHINNYPIIESERIRAYDKVGKPLYEKMDSRIGVKQI